jgi:hypothetical protein
MSKMTDQEIQRAYPGLKFTRAEGADVETATSANHPDILFVRSADGSVHYEPLSESEHRSRIEVQTEPAWKSAAEKRWLEAARARVAENEKILSESAPMARHNFN